MCISCKLPEGRRTTRRWRWRPLSWRRTTSRGILGPAGSGELACQVGPQLIADPLDRRQELGASEHSQGRTRDGGVLCRPGAGAFRVSGLFIVANGLGGSRLLHGILNCRVHGLAPGPDCGAERLSRRHEARRLADRGLGSPLPLPCLSRRMRARCSVPLVAFHLRVRSSPGSGGLRSRVWALALGSSIESIFLWGSFECSMSADTTSSPRGPTHTFAILATRGPCSGISCSRSRWALSGVSYLLCSAARSWCCESDTKSECSVESSLAIASTSIGSAGG